MVTLVCAGGGGRVACTCVLAAPLQRSSRACSTWPRTTTCASRVTRHTSHVTPHKPCHPKRNCRRRQRLVLPAALHPVQPLQKPTRYTRHTHTHTPLSHLRQAAAPLHQLLQPLPAHAQRSSPQIWREPDGPPYAFLLGRFGPVFNKQLLLPQRQQQCRLCDDGHMSLIGHMSHYRVTCGAAAAQLHVPTAARA